MTSSGGVCIVLLMYDFVSHRSPLSLGAASRNTQLNERTLLSIRVTAVTPLLLALLPLGGKCFLPRRFSSLPGIYLSEHRFLRHNSESLSGRKGPKFHTWIFLIRGSVQPLQQYHTTINTCGIVNNVVSYTRLIRWFVHYIFKCKPVAPVVCLTPLAPHSHKWGQNTLIISILSPKRDCSPKRVKPRFPWTVQSCHQ